MTNDELMRRAVALAVENVRHGGGPFGAVVSRQGEIVAEGVNRVTAIHDPTAHAEVQAIRKAAALLGRHNLSDCDIFASCEPCPMCLGAIYWARIGHLYFSACKDDAAAAGFDDALIYHELTLPCERRSLPTEALPRKDSNLPFEEWANCESRIDY